MKNDWEGDYVEALQAVTKLGVALSNKDDEINDLFRVIKKCTKVDDKEIKKASGAHLLSLRRADGSYPEGAVFADIDFITGAYWAIKNIIENVNKSLRGIYE